MKQEKFLLPGFIILKFEHSIQKNEKGNYIATS